MKKLIITVFLITVGWLSAIAGDEIKLTEGSLSSLKDGGVGCVVIDIKDTTFDNKMPLRKDDRFREIDDYIPECTKEFVREFNDNTKKFTMTENVDEAKYEFLVKIDNLDTYINVMSFKGGIGIKVWGSITITDIATGHQVAAFDIDEENNSGFTYNIAVEETFEGIAKFLAKKIKKGK